MDPAFSARCTCPPEPPIDYYGRGWKLCRGVWYCTRCGGVARADDQVPTIDDALRVALAQMTAGRRPH